MIIIVTGIKNDNTEFGRASYKCLNSKAVWYSEFHACHLRPSGKLKDFPLQDNYSLDGNQEVIVEIISKCRHKNKYYLRNTRRARKKMTYIYIEIWTWRDVTLTSAKILPEHFKEYVDMQYKPDNNAKIKRFWVVRKKGLRFWQHKRGDRNICDDDYYSCCKVTENLVFFNMVNADQNSCYACNTVPLYVF